jgi:hypothetical protein
MWDFSAVVYPEHESMTTDLFGPVAIDTNIRLAPMRQLHFAIERLKEGHYKAAITLAAGAEGMLPGNRRATLATGREENVETAKHPTGRRLDRSECNHQLAKARQHRRSARRPARNP